MAEQREAQQGEAALQKDQVKVLKELLVSQGWQLCQVLWAKHSIRKEMEKAQALRNLENAKSIYLQGYIDGMKSKDSLVKNAITPEPEAQEGPNY